MSKPRKLPNGKYKISYENKRRGIPRTRRTFSTRAECIAWRKHIEETSFNRLIGAKPTYTYAQALADYIANLPPDKKSAEGDKKNARIMRYPIWLPVEKRFIRLEDCPLNDEPGGIVTAMTAWLEDQRKITRRSYINNQYYEKRGNEWTLQPKPNGTNPPAPRRKVTSQRLIDKLESSKGRGPISNYTLRLRQLLVKAVLKRAYRDLRWTEKNLADFIQAVPSPPGRAHLTQGRAGNGQNKIDLSPTQLRDLIIHLKPGLDAAALAAAWIGWRKSNILDLQWSDVVFPVYEQHNDEIIQTRIGLIYAPGERTKNGDPLTHPMSQRIEQLLKIQWQNRNGRLVFHNKGKKWGDTRKAFNSAKSKANIHPGFRWHDLRHTWASHLIQAGANKGHIQELANWKDSKMVDRYAHLHIEHLHETVELASKIQ